MDTEFVVFDTETTGLYPHLGDAIVEIAAVRITKDGQVLGEFQKFVHSGIPSHPETVKIHGLTDEFIAKHGQPPQQVFMEFIHFIGSTTLVGHNIRGFDMKFLNRHLIQIGLPPAENNLIDTLDLARAKMPQLGNHKLGTLAAKFGLDYSKAHRAAEDVKINAEVFMRLLML
ncbi:MAG: 3'-5' exonuclease [Parcubacteria group bacterium]|nr:3'-5' exonuclease [Parcubacteria group bacterium]